MKSAVVCFISSLVCLSITVYAMSEGLTKLFTASGTMGFCLLGLGIGRLYSREELKGKRTKILLVLLLLASINLLILYLIF
ncbi:MAG: hypothetical protein HUK02_03150 [Bacteroidaceae bacterium]|nr:hypothetical protein [Bacteroidaceae bacterium]